ncbi:transporter associated domain-containing protein, partial [Pseudomonadota bacterium]
VGEFTTDIAAAAKEIHPQDDGTHLVDGGAYIRDLNRAMEWELPIDGPKTLNGLITEYLETIPEAGTSVCISGYPMDIVQTSSNTIKTIRLHPRRPQTTQQK